MTATRLTPLPVRRHAFTLLEMILATAILAIMIAAVGRVIGLTNRDRQTLAVKRADATAAGEQVIELLRHDLLRARRFAMLPDGRLRLIGYGSLNPQTLMPNGGLSRVEYQIVSQTLLRTQYTLDDPLDSLPWTQAVCPGVSGWSFTPTTLSAKPHDVPSAADVLISPTAGGMPIEARITLR